MSTTQISATISTATKARLDDIARMTGRSRQSIVEDAILREAMALEEIPDEFLVPARILLTRAAAKQVLDRIDHPQPAGASLKRALKAAGIKP